MLLPGQCAARVRRRSCELIVRYLGGDLSIIPEVMANRGLQEELAANAPEDPRRAFGEAVEGPGLASAVQLLERALPPVLEKLADKFCAKIDERFAAMERVRPGPYAPVGAGSSNPLTIPQYLNEREREHPGFAAIRKRFAPAFTTVVSMLKHEAVRSSGRSYAGGKRAAYTERDRPVLNHAWELSFAYRESLAAGRNGPTVLELLGAR